jgi:hypothetical protein
MNNMEQIKVINDFITRPQANELIDFIDHNLDIFVHNNGRRRYMLRFGYDEELPEQAIHSMEPVHEIRELLEHIFKKTNDFVGQDLYLTSWFLSKQYPGAKLTPHKDGAVGINEHLEYTAMLYLNDMYDGGAISFPELNINIIPQLGDLIIFKSLEHEHMVSEVKEHRYSLPMWFTKNERLKFNG